MIKFNSIREFRNVVKGKPWLYPLFIILAINLFKNRWHSMKEIVYLTKTDITEHKLLSLNVPDQLKIKICNNEYEKIISARLIIDDKPEYDKIVYNRLKNGDNLLALIDETNMNVISFLFVTFNNIKLFPVHKKVKIEKDSFGVYDVYTYPEYRKKGFYEITLSLTIKHYFEKNYRNMYLWVMKENQISVKTHSKLLINNVIGVFSERYRFGFRIIKSKMVSFQLDSLIND